MAESNPYTTPTYVDYSGSLQPAGSSTMTSQIRVMAILMMVHGGLACALGVMYIALGALMPALLEASSQHGSTPGEMPERWMFFIYFAMGAPAVIGGVLQLFAGWRNFDLRNRTLGIIAALGGVVASATCYCAPTAIAMAVYGMIVLLSPTVAQAFEWRAEGTPARDVLARFIYAHAPWPSPWETGQAALPSIPPAETTSPFADPPTAPPTKPPSADS